MESISNESKIHFYEFMEIQILHEYIQTGIAYFANAILNSDRFIHFRYFSQQISSLLSLLKDLFFLIKHKSLYAQNFYELERNSTQGKLSKKQILVSLLIWHILPYIGRKIEKKFNEIKQLQQNGEQPTGFIKKVFLQLFPICYMLLNLIQTILKFKYLLLPNSKFYNLQYSLTKTSLDYKQTDQQWKYPLAALLKSPGLFIILISHKIATYFFNKKSSKGVPSSRKRQVKAPSQNDRVKSVSSSRSGECPICGDKIKNAAMLKSSGYVFCYSCIFQYVKKYKRCPLSKVPSQEQSIQLIYD